MLLRLAIFFIYFLIETQHQRTNEILEGDSSSVQCTEEVTCAKIDVRLQVVSTEYTNIRYS